MKDGQQNKIEAGAYNGESHLRDFQERQKYCYPFKEYDPTGTNSSSNKMTHNNQVRRIIGFLLANHLCVHSYSWGS